MGNFRQGGNRSGGGGFNRGNRSGGSRFSGGSRSFSGSRCGGFNRGRDSEGPREMHDATCSNCGKACQVPFKPTGSKPVLCSDCFRKSDSSSGFNSRSQDRPSSSGDSGKQFAVINEKLDRILDVLKDLEIDVDDEDLDDDEDNDLEVEVDESEDTENEDENDEDTDNSEK